METSDDDQALCVLRPDFRTPPAGSRPSLLPLARMPARPQAAVAAQQAQVRSDYRINQRAVQEAWSQRNRDYWRHYRDGQPEYEQRNRDQQKLRDARGQDVDLAKMDVCNLPTGLYRIVRHPGVPRNTSSLMVVEIMPVCANCPCKMGASREDLIDCPANSS